MIYLTGVTNDRIEPALIAAGIGLMVQPNTGYMTRIDRYDTWAADNGCYADTWEETKHLPWLDLLPRTCLFAVSPDVYPDAKASLERGVEYAPLLRHMGFRVAIVAQDGAESLHWPWEEFDCLFIGGERGPDSRREWKIGPGAWQLCREARRRGKWVHMGRVNSIYRARRAEEMGVLSCDGTFLKYRKRRRAGESDEARHARGESELEAMLGEINANPPLWVHESPAR